MKPLTPEQVAKRIKQERRESLPRYKKHYKPSSIGEWRKKR
jgi:hypothetical protein